MADLTNYKLSADFNGDGTMDLIWAGRADTLSDLNVGEGLSNTQVTVMGQAITKLTVKAATTTALGGVKVNGNGLIMDPSTSVLKIKLGTGLSFGSSGELNASASSDFNGSADNVTETASRVFMTPTERTKLQGVEDGANKYVHPTTHTMDILTETTDKKIFTAGERSKLQSVADGANNYVHPANHSATMISETTDRMFVTSAEKQKIASIDPLGGTSDYVHPDTHPASMIVEDDTRQFVTLTQKTKLSTLAGGTGRYSGVDARNTVTGETVATYVSNETVTSDNNAYSVFRLANKNVITGTISFSKNGVLIAPAGYTVDYVNGTITLVVPNSSGTYKASYTYSADGKISTHYAPIVSGTVKLYVAGVLIASTNYTVDYTNGIITPTVNLGTGSITADYTHTQGTVITHNKNITGTYQVIVTSNSATNGTLGEVWTEQREANSFIVRNTGSNASATFDWVIVKN
jgi:hypothetical protein